MKPIRSKKLGFDTFEIELETSQTPFSLYQFLIHGGSAMDRRQASKIEQDAKIITERIPLIVEIFDVLLAKRTAGTSDKTLTNYLYGLKSFFSWADQDKRSITLSSLASDYIQYTEHLLYRCRTERSLSDQSAYAIACSVSCVFDGVLNLRVGLLGQSRIRRERRSPQWKHSEEATLDSTAQEMGRALLKISNALSVEAISGKLPLSIPIAETTHLELGLHGFPGPIPINGDGTPHINQLHDQRRSLINFRTEVEMLLFISQTGMNLEQARTQRLLPFQFISSKIKADCLHVVKSYKARRHGEVEFEIFPEYKKHFLRYLAFRRQIFPDDNDGPLFKFINTPGRMKPRYYSLTAVEGKFKAIAVPYRTPRKLRNLRLNDLLDRTSDPILVASMGQNSPEVLLKSYARPRPKTAFREVSQYLQLCEESIKPPGPGACINQTPQLIVDAPRNAPRPDCRSPAGCLFCDQQRDINSLDHIWSLLSYRHLKAIELSKYKGKDAVEQPAYVVIQRISDKASDFASVGSESASWAAEAQARVEEGWFHPAWQDLISFAETIV